MPSQEKETVAKAKKAMKPRKTTYKIETYSDIRDAVDRYAPGKMAFARAADVQVSTVYRLYRPNQNFSEQILLRMRVAAGLAVPLPTSVPVGIVGNLVPTGKATLYDEPQAAPFWCLRVEFGGGVRHEESQIVGFVVCHALIPGCLPDDVMFFERGGDFDQMKDGDILLVGNNKGLSLKALLANSKILVPMVSDDTSAPIPCSKATIYGRYCGLKRVKK